MGGIYILNQITDIETDRLNKKLFILSENLMSVKAATIEMLLLLGAGIFFSYKFNYNFFILILISTLLGIAYSLPPLRLKGKPILDTLNNGIGYGMINFAAGYLLSKPFEWSIFLTFLPYFLSICAIFINTTIVDIEGDKRSGAITTGVFLGAKVSAIISTTLLALGIIVARQLGDYICLIPAITSFPLFLISLCYTIFKNGVHRQITIASFRLPGLVFTLITGYLYPGYLIFLVFLFIALRIYYKSRFGMTYPTLAQG